MTTARARLGVEVLERRDCPTTASLYNGVLTVQGTDGDDDIQVVRSGDWIGAAGQWFDARSVSRLVQIPVSRLRTPIESNERQLFN